jgi:PRTRC genetic system protein E
MNWIAMQADHQEKKHMSMFKEIYQIATTATLALLISADETSGKLTINLVPKPRKDIGEAALTKDLTLTATPEEFDNEFVEALRGYRGARQRLIEQAEATREVLDAAKSASAKKAADAVSKASKPAANQPVKQASMQNASDDDDDENGESNGGTHDGHSGMAVATNGVQGAATMQPQLFG